MMNQIINKWWNYFLYNIKSSYLQFSKRAFTKDNNNNSFLDLTQKNKNWMETIIAPSNKHQSPSNDQG
jgi:hypothetical protein